MTRIAFDPQEDLLTEDGQAFVAAVETLIASAYTSTKGCAQSRIFASAVTKDGVDIGDWKITIEPTRTVVEGRG